MLVERFMVTPDDEANTGDFPSPVVGALVDDTVPTSADVHLYADPTTFSGRRPRLYADCEGFQGGEAVPKSVQSRRRAGSVSDTAKLIKNLSPRRPQGQGPYRNLAWANNKEMQKREFFVAELYPRVLYTFSDVVVFVLRTAK
jgi:hypothetical protein